MKGKCWYPAVRAHYHGNYYGYRISISLVVFVAVILSDILIVIITILLMVLIQVSLYYQKRWKLFVAWYKQIQLIEIIIVLMFLHDSEIGVCHIVSRQDNIQVYFAVRES